MIGQKGNLVEEITEKLAYLILAISSYDIPQTHPNSNSNPLDQGGTVRQYANEISATSLRKLGLEIFWGSFK